MDQLSYTIFNPTGNITALVESDVAAELRTEAAAAVMKRHPEVEQVGFVCLPKEPGEPVHLRMAGGEFCGNATMSAAALSVLRSDEPMREGEQRTVLVETSEDGVPVRVDLRTACDGQPDACFEACVHMPAALGIGDVSTSPVSDAEGSLLGKVLFGSLPLVKLQGISHVIIEADHYLYPVKDSRGTAEKLAKFWCEEVNAEGLGVMFLDEAEKEQNCELTPLVYVPKSRTIFWEQACASGATACAVFLADRAGKPVDVRFRQPGGDIRVSCDPETGDIQLYGTTRLCSQVGDI